MSVEGATAAGSSAEDSDKLIRSAYVRCGKVVKAAGITVD